MKTAGYLANLTSSELLNCNKEKQIHGVNTIFDANQNEVTFLSNYKFKQMLFSTNAGLCIIHPSLKEFAPKNLGIIIHPEPYVAYALIAQSFHPIFPDFISGSNAAFVHPNTKIGKNVYLGYGVVIEENVTIGDFSYVDHNSIIKCNSNIGKKCYIGSNVVIQHAVIGNNNIILSGAKIGQDGFGFATDKKGFHHIIPQIGRVIIKNSVMIGSCTTIDRGTINDTIIENGVMIDNLVQVGHNVNIGENSIIVAQVGIAGSTTLGKNCVVGGQSGIAGHLKIGDRVQIAGKSGVLKNIDNDQSVAGHPAIDLYKWQRQQIKIKNEYTRNT